MIKNQTVTERDSAASDNDGDVNDDNGVIDNEGWMRLILIVETLMIMVMMKINVMIVMILMKMVMVMMVVKMIIMVTKVLYNNGDKNDRDGNEINDSSNDDGLDDVSAGDGRYKICLDDMDSGGGHSSECDGADVVGVAITNGRDDYGNDLDGGGNSGACNDDGNADDIESNISTKCKVGCS